MPKPAIRVRRNGRTWGYSCMCCLNQPGVSGLVTWGVAMLYAEDHLRAVHPVIDWSFFEA